MAKIKKGKRKRLTKREREAFAVLKLVYGVKTNKEVLTRALSIALAAAKAAGQVPRKRLN